MKKFYLSVLSLILLSGCSASGPMYKPSEISSDKNAMIYVYRPSQFVNGGGYPEIKINNKSIGPLKNGGYLYKEVEAGKYTVLSEGNIMNWNFPDINVPVILKQGETAYLRLLSSASTSAIVGSMVYMGRDSNLHLVKPEHAKQEIKTMRLSN